MAGQKSRAFEQNSSGQRSDRGTGLETRRVDLPVYHSVRWLCFGKDWIIGEDGLPLAAITGEYSGSGGV